MKKTILLYGILLALLTGFLKIIEYRFWVRDLSLEIYVGTVAVFFAALGIWAGLRLTNKKSQPVPGAEPASALSHPAQDIETSIQRFSISKREFEVLQLIAQGFSNQEIADKLFLSLNTVKTHSSNLFLKLDVKRRTQAVQKAKSLGLI